tara:strand:+ start:267 stop:1217 length:951 start_codon:yes stop_codon:yes gene_type:complete
MKKILLSILVITALSSIGNTQQTSEEVTKKIDTGAMVKSDEKAEEGWNKGGVFGVNFGQVHLENWQGGGQSNISVNSLFSSFRNYKKGKIAWDNSLDVAYGIVSLDGADFVKSDDRIELNSKYGRQFKNNKKLYYSGLVNLRTQFAPGFNSEDGTLLSRIMSPGYLTGAIGIDYKPNANLSVFIAPVSYRGTFVMDDKLNAIGAYGVDTNSSLRNETGGLFMAKFQKENIFKLKNVDLKTQATFFSNYFDSPQNIDVLWDVLISMKVNKYISASISTSFVYDHDILLPLVDDAGVEFTGRRVQFKEVLNIGFNYKF